MATISVPPGRVGDIVLQGFPLYLSGWGMNIEIENEIYKHFNRNIDANGLYWAGLLTGFCSGQSQIKGNFDNTPGSYLPTNKSVWLDSTGNGFLGYTATVGFSIYYTVIAVDGGQTTDTPAGATFGATIKITECTFSTNGN